MSKEGDSCILCGIGHYERILEDFNLEDKNGHEVRIPQVAVFKCTSCGDKVVPVASHNYIEKRAAEANEQLSPIDVQTLFKTLGRSQSEISEDLGLGSKTYGRWLSGSQHPSKALGFYLRIVAEFPQVYAWVANRAWKKQTPVYRLGTVQAREGCVINEHTFTDLKGPENCTQSSLNRLGNHNYAALFRNTTFEHTGTAR